MTDPVLGDYARNLPDARESEVLSLFATIINNYVVYPTSLSVSNSNYKFATDVVDDRLFFNPNKM